MAAGTQSNQNKSQNKNEQQLDDSKKTINLALVGGVVGAGMGYLASPEGGRKIATRIGQSGVIRGAGRELGRTAQDMIMEQAMIALRQNAAGYIGKYGGSLFGEENVSEEKTTEDKKIDLQEQYKELKEENNSLNENLQRIEEKLNALLEASNNK